MKKSLLLLLLLLAVALPAAAQIEVAPLSWEPFIGSDPIDGVTLVGKGYACYSVTTAVRLSTTPNCAVPGVAIHRLAQHARIIVESGSIRLRFDGTDPTATAGELMTSASPPLILTHQRALLLELRMISTAGTAVVTVTYGR